MPEKSHRLFGDLLDGPESIVIAVGTWKDDDSEFHRLWLILGVGFEVSLARRVLGGAALQRCDQAQNKFNCGCPISRVLCEKWELRTPAASLLTLPSVRTGA